MVLATSTTTKNVGTNGSWRITIDQLSYDATSNASKIRVRGILLKGEGYTTSYNDNVSASISGQNSWSGTIAFSVPPNGSDTVIDQTFTVTHAADKTKTVTYTVTLNDTGTSTFGTPGGVSDNLVLKNSGTGVTTVPKNPSIPTFSSIQPTSVIVSWTAPTDNGGSTITGYLLRSYKNGSNTPVVHSTLNNVSRLVSGLTPAATYEFEVIAINAIGNSLPSPKGEVQLLSGAWIRFNGTWRMAVPHVRVNGVWKMVVPYVRVSGVWKTTA